MINESLKSRASKIRLVAFDVDGVLTDGKIIMSFQGEVVKHFSSLDGFGIKLLQQSGIETAIISARHSSMVTRRASELGIQHVYQGCHNKLETLHQLVDKTKIALLETAYIGDDLLDLPLIKRVGLGCTVPNAHPFVKQHSSAVTSCFGGYGAVRELSDFILEAQNKLEPILMKYL